MAQGSVTQMEDARQLILLLERYGFAARFAGGCVRDKLMGIAPKDFDIATAAIPQEVINVCFQHEMKTIPTGIDHGTLTVMTLSGPVEVTTLRRDVASDGRHAVVEFAGATFETDAARRDFTINAMFEDAHGQVYDYFGGLSDLQKKVLRFVGDPPARIKEDYLRILRFFRFWARFGFDPDKEALIAIHENMEGLGRLSQERITSEFLQILDGNYLDVCTKIFQTSGILNKVLPESKHLNRPDFIVIGPGSAHLEGEIRVICRFITMLDPNDPKWTSAKINTLAKRMRLSEKFSRKIWAVLEGWQNLPTMERSTSLALDFVDTLEQHSQVNDFIDEAAQVWQIWIDHTGDDSRADALAWIITTEKTWRDRRLMPVPLNGNVVMEKFPDISGMALGKVLKHLRQSFREGYWQEPEDGIRWLNDHWPSDVPRRLK
jgi:tRNA nucleotidyltransferase/poly(A) polymerase